MCEGCSGRAIPLMSGARPRPISRNHWVSKASVTAAGIAFLATDPDLEVTLAVLGGQRVWRIHYLTPDARLADKQRDVSAWIARNRP